MIRLVMVVIVCCWASLCDAQRRNENWVMSDHNWVQFVPGFGPVLIYAPSALYTVQCNVSMSDTAGALQFYGTSQDWQGLPLTPGLFGSDHLLYPGYPDPADVPSSGYAQGTLVIPRPGHPNRYYVFYTGHVYSNNGAPACYYLEIDMALRNGLGDVIPGSFQPLMDSTTTHIHGVAHSNGVDYWLVLHRYLTNEFLTYLVSNNGVSSSPGVSASGPVFVDSLSISHPNSLAYYYGHLTADRSGDKLVLSSGNAGSYDRAFMELFNFDRATGAINQYASIPVDSNATFSGVDFSSSGEYLYVMDIVRVSPNGTLNYGNARIWQYDVSTSDPVSIANSKFLVDQQDSVLIYGWTLSGLSLAPDQNIYSHYAITTISTDDEWLGAITQPDLPGAACDLQQHVVPLLSDDVMSFPNHIKRYNTDFSVQIENEQVRGTRPNIELYPNPSSGLVRVTVSGINTQEVVVRDVLGREQLRTTLRSSAERFTLNVATLASGAYTLTVTDGKTTRLSKSLIKE